jgi:hypothetical protein
MAPYRRTSPGRGTIEVPHGLGSRYSRFYGVGGQAASRPQQRQRPSILSSPSAMASFRLTIRWRRSAGLEFGKRPLEPAARLWAGRSWTCGIDQIFPRDVRSSGRKRSSALAYGTRPNSKTLASSRARTKFCSSTAWPGLEKRGPAGAHGGVQIKSWRNHARSQDGWRRTLQPIRSRSGSSVCPSCRHCDTPCDRHQPWDRRAPRTRDLALQHTAYSSARLSFGT